METLGKFTVEDDAWIETHRGDVSETISLDYELAEEEGYFFWVLKGYGHQGFILSDGHVTPEEAYQNAVDYTGAWALVRSGNMQSDYNHHRLGGRV